MACGYAHSMKEISSSAKFSWVFNFMNFTNFPLFAKIFQQKFLCVTHTPFMLDNVLGLSHWIHKEISSKRYLWRRHCLFDSCELKQTAVLWYMLDKPGLYTTPTAYYMCGMCVQQIHKIISTKSSKVAICENLDPRKFSAIWYVTFQCFFVIWCIILLL